MVERAGLHAGKGPKGWTRSDAQLREEVSDRLMEDRLLDARGIVVAADAGVVILSGEVPGASDVAHAEMLARATPGCAEVRNLLRYQPGRRKVEKLKPADEPPGLQGRWGRWIPPFVT
jgi:osmotically-inducible protein OsmY